MKTYLNTDTRLLTAAATALQPIKSISAKHALILDVIPSTTLADGTIGILCAKPKAIYTGDPVALNQSWEPISPAGYRFSLSLYTSELLALFVDEISEVILIADITITEPGEDPIGCQTFEIVAERPVWRGDEMIPTPASVLTPVVMYLDTVPRNLTDFFMFPGGIAPTSGLYVAADDLYTYTLKGGVGCTWAYERRKAMTP